MSDTITTFGELKASGYKPRSVKDELRDNVITKLKNKESIFPGIIGYNDSVIPELINAILSKHNFILLGLRGQAKTRILRLLTTLLDEKIPIVKGSPLNEDPCLPVTKYTKEMLDRDGDNTEISWISRENRYQEKLATPDVTMADLIGDIDPIKAVSKKLNFSDEDVIHFGIIPRSNRGIFAINELPDLQPRIQVGLFNILEENDLQIRGFPVRFPLDLLLVFSANPEDYTNRGNIITPLKDRIGSQIITHYPKNIDESLRITEQEAWVKRQGTAEVMITPFFKELIERITIEARTNKVYIDQGSGVSVRMTISSMENLISNIERRALLNGETKAYPRITDLHYVISAVTGKMELVYEGEQEGTIKVALSLIGLAIKKLFSAYCPPAFENKKEQSVGNEQLKPTVYDSILHYFESGNSISVNSQSPFTEYFDALSRIPGLRELADQYLPVNKNYDEEIAAGMEFILEGLHYNSKLSKSFRGGNIEYGDIIRSMLNPTL